MGSKRGTIATRIDDQPLPIRCGRCRQPETSPGELVKQTLRTIARDLSKRGATNLLNFQIVNLGDDISRFREECEVCRSQVAFRLCPASVAPDFTFHRAETGKPPDPNGQEQIAIVFVQQSDSQRMQGSVE